MNVQALSKVTLTALVQKFIIEQAHSMKIGGICKVCNTKSFRLWDKGAGCECCTMWDDEDVAVMLYGEEMRVLYDPYRTKE